MKTDHLFKEGSLFLVAGAFGTVYNANTVAKIDANLTDLPADHPDVDRLLDARKIVSLVNHIWGTR